MSLKQYRKETADIAGKCQKAPGKQVQSRALLAELETLATKWFEMIEPSLRSTDSLPEEVLVSMRERLGRILELVGGKPSKSIVKSTLDEILQVFHTDVLVPVPKREVVLSKYPSLSAVLSSAKGLVEVDYLTEAVECARLGKRRAALILGWCATVNRFHSYIEKEGFAKFNHASVQMSAIQSGRYKRFNKKFDIQNLSDLRMTVFDNDLLWVLEYLGAIDGNQHERLGICFTMRNTCAHPGEGTVSEENVLSFFSDISTLVLANPKFSLGSA